MCSKLPLNVYNTIFHAYFNFNFSKKGINNLTAQGLCPVYFLIQTDIFNLVHLNICI